LGNPCSEKEPVIWAVRAKVGRFSDRKEDASMKKRSRIFGVALGVAFLVFSIIPAPPAQALNTILDGVWFKLKLSYNGYKLDYSDNSVVGPDSGASTVYARMVYDDSEAYWMMTCSQDYADPGLWHVAWPDTPISSDLIFGDLKIWDFFGDPWVRFNNGYATFYTDALWLSAQITMNGPSLKKASFKSFGCAVWGDMGDKQHAILGSCGLSGSSVAPEKVPSGCKLP
jgi:hypothetical protein